MFHADAKTEQSIVIHKLGLATGAAILALHVAWASPAAAQGLPHCRADLAACIDTANACQNGLNICNQDLQTCDSTLVTVQGQADACNSDLSTCSSDLSTCGSNLTSCNSSLSSCNSSLTSTRNQLTACNGSLSSCNAQRSACQADLAECRNDLASTCPLEGMLQMLANFRDARVALGDTLTIADCNLFGGSFVELEILQRLDTAAGEENSHFLQISESTGDGLSDGGSGLFLFRDSPVTEHQVQFSYGLEGVRADFESLRTCAILATTLGLCT